MALSRLALVLAAGASAATFTACGSSHSASPASSAAPTSPSTSTSAAPSTPTADASASDAAATANALKAAFKASLLRSLTSQSPPIPYDSAGAQCVANNLVDHVGVAQMEKAGVQHVLGEAVTWSVDDATYLATQLVDCAPDNSVVQFFRRRLNDGFGTRITASQKACMDRVVTRDVSIRLLTSEYDGKAASGRTAFQSLLASAAPGCGIR